MFITPGFPSNEDDTTCIPALQLYARNLSLSGYKVTVITTQYPFSDEPYLWHNIQVIPCNGANNKLKKLLLPQRIFRIASRLHKTTPIDLIHSFWLNETTLWANHVARKLNVPIVATAMGQEAQLSATYLQKIKRSKIPVIALSEFQASDLQKRGISPSTIIQWGTEAIAVQKKRIDLISVGNLIPLKQTDYFISICRELKNLRDDFNAVIIGDGPLRTTLEELTASEGLETNISFYGEQSYFDTTRFIAQSKLLVHASRYEGFGMTIIEALNAQTQVYAFNTGIATEIKEVNQLSGDPSRDAIAIHQSLQTSTTSTLDFSIHRTVQSYRKLYKELF